MAIALIIKNADFTSNKITTVPFGDVPCTGVAFVQSTVSLTSYTPTAIEYTLTPSNTTDPISWESSDTDVVTVSGGVLSAVGLGTATITVTCGYQTATATVIVSLVSNPAYAVKYVSKQEASSYSYGADYDFVSNNESSNRIACYGSGPEAGTYMSVPSSYGIAMPVIKLPRNTASVTFAFSNTTRLVTTDDAIAYWLKNESAGVPNYPLAAHLILKDEWYSTTTTPAKTINVPEGADSLIYCFMVYSVGDGETAADVAEAVGLTITFNSTSAS